MIFLPKILISFKGTSTDPALTVRKSAVSPACHPMEKRPFQNPTEQMLDRFRQGDAKAFASLYRTHWNQVFRFSRLYLKNDEDAEDVVQEVFIRLWQIHERIHPDGNFSGLLFIITRNLIFNRFHKQINPLSFKVSVLAALESSDDIESEVSARDLAEYIDRLIDLILYNKVVPAVNQIETNLISQQTEIYRWMKKYRIQHEGYAPFGQGKIDALYDDPVLMYIADRYHKTVRQVVLRFQIQSGVVVIPKTMHPDRLKENFEVFDFGLEANEMEILRSFDKATPLIGNPQDPVTVASSIEW